MVRMFRFFNRVESLILNYAVTRKLARFFLTLIPKDMVFPILSGALRGKRWIIRSAPYAMFMGFWEPESQDIFKKYIRKGMTVYDIGGHVGFFTILSSDLTGRDGRVFVFEPVPQHLALLKRHVELNHCSNVTVLDTAISSHSGEELVFFQGYEVWGSHLAAGFSQKGQLKVKTTSMDELVFNLRMPHPDFIKMDIEGAEFLALQGGRKVINEFKPVIVLSTHGPEVKEQCCDFLKSAGYDWSPLAERDDEFLCLYRGKPET